MRLLARLFVLVVVAALSAMAIQFHSELELGRRRAAEVQAAAPALAKLSSVEIGQIAEGALHTLIASVELPATGAKDTEGCRACRSAVTVGSSPVQTDSEGPLAAVGLERMSVFEGKPTLLGIVLAASVSLLLFLAWRGARRLLLKPFGRLVDGASHLRLGSHARCAKSPDPQSESARVDDAFDPMPEVLRQQECELHRARLRAEEEATRITTIFEGMIDCVVTIDRNWRITYINELAMQELAEQRDVVGVDFWEAFKGAIGPEVATLYRKAMSTQRQCSLDTYCARRCKWYEINAFPSGEGLAILVRDVTDHKHAVEARRKMEEELHQVQKMEAVGQLTGGVAHDFNNLLMIIAGNLEVIEEHATDHDSVRRLAATARKAADRGVAVVGQLLAFSRRQELNPRPVHAGHLMRDFEDLIRRALGEKCELRISADEQLWLCDVDPAQLQMAILNLTVNGRDAMPAGGVLEITAGNDDLVEHAIGVEPGSYVRISVTDTGCGMTAEVLDRAFDPFFTTKDVGRGTGLGLSMVYGFVRQSRGDVTIQSARGSGTTISLYLPRSSQRLNTNAPAARLQKAAEYSGRVLLVDDDDDVAEVTSAMLSKLGYQVLCARSGVEAIRILESDKEFDLLLTDVFMPLGVNGIELAREARRICKGIKVLLASGNATDVLARYGIGDEFPIIGKPFGRSELARQLQSVMHAA